MPFIILIVLLIIMFSQFWCLPLTTSTLALPQPQSGCLPLTGSIVNILIIIIFTIVLNIGITITITTDIVIIIRMNEIVDAANISQLNSNAPAVFPMGVR